jgi:membrane protease YdiL (CAAX protease family)
VDKKVPKTYVLYLSIAIIIAFWVFRFSQAIFFPESLDYEKTMPSMFRLALLVHGAIIVLVSLLLWLGKENFASLGFRKQDLVKQILRGMLLAVGIWFISQVVGSIVNAILPNVSSQETGEMENLFTDLRYLPIWLFMALSAGFAEELQRIFILTRFEAVWGRIGLVLALIFSSITFGMGHLYQGIGSAVAVGINGLLWALVYLRKRSALEAMVCHAVYDITAVTIAYLVFSGT